MGRITGNVREFDKSLSAASARVTAFGAVAGSFYLVSKAVTEAAKSMMLVDKELIELNTFLGQSQGKLKEFGNSLFAIAKNTSTSFSAVSEAAKEFARQGLSMEETLKRTNDALVLSRISGLGAAESVTALTTAVNSFNKSGLTSSEVINKLIQVDSQFSVSSNDLAQALSRVGSSAQDSGLSIDQLVAAVTTAQQTTGRGGAVIGNALKTIFTRMKRPEVIDQLEAIGVSVKDSNGYFLDGLTILQNYTTATKNLSQTEKARTAELLGGIFQINVLNSLLNDVSKSNGIYARALKASSSATDEAFNKNEALNESLSATLERTKANLTQKGAAIATPLLTPVIKTGAALINKTLNVFDKKEEEGDEAGQKTGRSFGESLLKSLGAVLAGPGLVIAGAIALAIGKKVFSFGMDATRNLLGITTSSQNILNLQNLISSTLSAQPAIMQQVLAGQMSQTQAAQLLLGIMKQQGAQLQMNQTISSTLATTLNQGGFSVSPVVGLKRKAMGHIPKADQAMERAGALAGGYSPGAVVKAPSSIGGIMNTAEKVKNISGFRQPFINPPEGSRAGNLHKKNSIKQTGINPYTYDGFIPNFNPMKWVNNEIVLNNVSTKQLSPKALELNNIADGGIGLKNNDIYDTITGRIKKTILFSEKTGEKKAFEKETMDNLRLFLEGKLPKGHPSETMYEAEYLMQSKQGKISKEDLLKEIPNGDFKPGGRAGNFVTRAYENEARKLVNQGKRQFIPGKQNSFLDLYLSKKTKGGMQGYEVKMGEYTPTEILTKILKEKFANRKHNNDKERHLNFGTYGLIATHNKGFIPNFAYLDNVKKLESKAGNGTAIFDTKPFPHVRNSSQPTFQSAINDHGGLKNALSDSVSMQKGAGLIKSDGFIPNFGMIDKAKAWWEQKMQAEEAAQRAAHAKKYGKNSQYTPPEEKDMVAKMMMSTIASNLPMMMSGFANQGNVKAIANVQRAVPLIHGVGSTALDIGRAKTGPGKALALGKGVLTHAPGIFTAFQGAKQLEESVKNEQFQKAKDKTADKFNKLTQNVSQLSQSIGELDDAYSDPNVSTSTLIKLGKKQQELLRSISKTNPAAAAKLATASSNKEKQDILLEVADSEAKTRSVKDASTKFLEMKDEKRTPQAISSFFSDLVAQADTSKGNVDTLSPDNFFKFLKDTGIQGSETVFKEAPPELIKAFISSLKTEKAINQKQTVAANKITEIRKVPMAIQSENERKQSLRVSKKNIEEGHLGDMLSFASNFGPRAAISARTDINVARESEKVNSSFNSKLATLSQGNPNLTRLIGKNVGESTTKELETMAANELDPKLKLELNNLVGESKRSNGTLSNIYKSEKYKETLDLKLLGYQEKLSSMGGLKASLNYQARKETRNEIFKPLTRASLGKSFGSQEEVGFAGMELDKALLDQHGSDFYSEGEKEEKVQSATEFLTKSKEREAESQARTLDTHGRGEDAARIREKISSGYYADAAESEARSHYGLAPLEVKQSMANYSQNNAKAVLEKKTDEERFAAADASTKPRVDAITNKLDSDTQALNEDLLNSMKESFGKGLKIENASIIVGKLTREPGEEPDPEDQPWMQQVGDWFTGLFSSSKPTPTNAGSTPTLSKGFIPNFKHPLRDAIDRESKFVPFNSIRVNQSSKLMQPNNPLGLAVTNTIDEPMGLASVGLANNGYIPNFAAKPPFDWFANNAKAVKAYFPYVKNWTKDALKRAGSSINAETILTSSSRHLSALQSLTPRALTALGPSLKPDKLLLLIKEAGPKLNVEQFKALASTLKPSQLKTIAPLLSTSQLTTLGPLVTQSRQLAAIIPTLNPKQLDIFRNAYTAGFAARQTLSGAANAVGQNAGLFGKITGGISKGASSAMNGLKNIVGKVTSIMGKGGLANAAGKASTLATSGALASVWAKTKLFGNIASKGLTAFSAGSAVLNLFTSKAPIGERMKNFGVDMGQTVLSHYSPRILSTVGRLGMSAGRFALSAIPVLGPVAAVIGAGVGGYVLGNYLEEKMKLGEKLGDATIKLSNDKQTIYGQTIQGREITKKGEGNNQTRNITKELVARTQAKLDQDPHFFEKRDAERAKRKAEMDKKIKRESFIREQLMDMPAEEQVAKLSQIEKAFEEKERWESLTIQERNKEIADKEKAEKATENNYTIGQLRMEAWTKHLQKFPPSQRGEVVKYLMAQEESFLSIKENFIDKSHHKVASNYTGFETGKTTAEDRAIVFKESLSGARNKSIDFSGQTREEALINLYSMTPSNRAKVFAGIQNFAVSDQQAFDKNNAFIQGQKDRLYQQQETEQAKIREEEERKKEEEIFTPTAESGFADGFIPAFKREKASVLSSSSYIGHRNAVPMRSNVYKNAVINSAEIEVPASEVYSRMFGPIGSSMKPKDSSQTHAILNPAQQQALGFNAGFIPNFSAEQFTIAITEAMKNGMSSFAEGMIPSVSHSNVVNINDGRSYQGSSNEIMDGVLDILQSKYPKEIGKLGPKIAKR